MAFPHPNILYQGGRGKNSSSSKVNPSRPREKTRYTESKEPKQEEMGYGNGI